MIVRDPGTAAHPACCAAIALLLFVSGCQMGPGAMKVGHQQYSAVLRQILNEQMLLNLVRLRYTDAPMFLQITSISTQFVFDQSGSVSAALTENVGDLDGKNPDLFSFGGTIGYQERPTITYAVPNNSEFLRGLLVPIQVDQLALIAESGWSGGEVMRLAVERMNGLSNAPSASGPTPSNKPNYAEFLETIGLMRTLMGEGLIGLEYEEHAKVVSDPIPATAINTFGMAEVMKLGVEFTLTDDGRYVMTRKTRVLVLRFSLQSETSAEAIRLRQLLRLDPGRSRFELVEYDDSETDDLDPNAVWTDLALNTRSTLGIMYYAANAVEVPKEHLSAGIAMETHDDRANPFDWSELMGDLFTIHSSKARPENAAVRVRHRGYWFYISDVDHASKSTFSLVLALSSLASVPVESTKPVLTLPVGGG